MNNKIGLVLGGGGGKGAYHIGVWEALEEFGLFDKISVFAGSSVGALNALLFTQGNSNLGKKVWENIFTEDILKFNPEKYKNRIPEKLYNFFKEHGFFSRDGLIDIIERYCDYEKFINSKKVVYGCCSDLSSFIYGTKALSSILGFILNKKIGNPVYFKLNDYNSNKIVKILLASSAIPVIFDEEEIDGKLYFDGGISENIPIKPVYNEGCDIIITVPCSRDEVYDINKYPDTTIIEILPQEDQGGMIKGTLNFSPTSAKVRFKQGYEDAKKILQEVYEIDKIQRDYAFNLLKIKGIHENNMKQYKRIIEERNISKNNLDKKIRGE
ncbi:MAG: patatin-like phospholipase family protein [Spirochaetes bacterium]|nr:patatin-like phospholipase family protein [Spirochaetota bacterium]